MVSTGTDASDAPAPVDRGQAGDSAAPQLQDQSTVGARWAGQPAGHQPLQQPSSEKSSEKSSGQSTAVTFDKSNTQFSEQSANSSADKSSDKSNQPPQQLPDQSSAASSGHSPDQPSLQTSDQVVTLHPTSVSDQSDLSSALQSEPVTGQHVDVPKQADSQPEQSNILSGQTDSLTVEQTNPITSQPASLTAPLGPLLEELDPTLLEEVDPTTGQHSESELTVDQPASVAEADVGQLLSSTAREPESRPTPTRSPKPPKIRITRPPRETSVFAALLPRRGRVGSVTETRASYRTPAAAAKASKPKPPISMSGRKTAFGGDGGDLTRGRTSVFDRLSRPDTKTRGKSSAAQEQPPTTSEEIDRPRAEELYDRLITGRSLHDQPDSASREIAAARANISETPEAPPPRLVAPLARQPTVASIVIEDETRSAARATPSSSKPAQRTSVFDRLAGGKTGRVRGAAKADQDDAKPSTAKGGPSHDEPEAKVAKEDDDKVPKTKGRKGNAESGKGKEAKKGGGSKKEKDAAKTDKDATDETDKENDDKKERKRDKQSSIYDRLFAGKPATTSSERTSLVEERETAKRQEAKKRINKRKIQPKPEKHPVEPPKQPPRAPRAPRRQGGSVFDRLYRGVPVHATRDTDLLTPDGPAGHSRRRSSDASASDQEGSDSETRPRSKSPLKRSSSNLHMADVALVSSGEENRVNPSVLPQVKRTKAFSIFGVPVVFPGRLFGRGKGADDVESFRERRPQLDPSMVNTTSMARGAIPVLPRSAAYFCLLLNIFLPGLGTAASGVLVHCMGRTRYSVETTKQDRWASTCTNLVVAMMQLYTLTFCLVGWFWSVGWGVIMVTVADQHLTLQGMSAEERAAQTRRTSFQQLVTND